MTTVKITHTEGDDVRETDITNPVFVDVLLNVNEVSVDGEIYTDVTQVRYKDD